jgi:hypothetical protein
VIIATVVEGPTDRLVLETILDKLIPGKHRYLSLQPPILPGETGAGWKGVRAWCWQRWQRTGSDLETLLSPADGPPIGLLVLHVDAAIAFERDLQDALDDPVDEVLQPCPPAAATVDRLRQVILRWLQRVDLPQAVILAIPAQDMESWTFAALFPADPLCERADYECIRRGAHHPGYKLTLRAYGNLLSRSGGAIKKSERRYQEAMPQLAAGWDAACLICSQAQRFIDSASAFRGSHPLDE